ncbi:type II toxin-antitoxin system PemK/MazF family toxin [endosymbiont GvMRE of Glomus versiforme]|uniref:type II toxin-antitoxin system PemK/MazF family toxin n=1 Tax=endosymbiont GvMRE of Glomus versiforme TaxID=2039283 RepID=UPI001558A1D6|nr:type II toxin-antitoxin system PemK/MazF family toxin [endosymbiont GvMRE of Glomus versiforme]
MSKIDKIYPFQVASHLQNKKGVILIDQIRTVDRKRFGDKLGKLSIEEIEKVEKSLHITLALKN